MERTSPALQQRRSGGAPGPAPPWAGEWARCRGNGRVGATCFLGYGLGGVHLGVLPLSPSCPPAPSSHGVARCGWIISAGHVMNPWHCGGGKHQHPQGPVGARTGVAPAARWVTPRWTSLLGASLGGAEWDRGGLRTPLWSLPPPRFTPLLSCWQPRASPAAPKGPERQRGPGRQLRRGLAPVLINTRERGRRRGGWGLPLFGTQLASPPRAAAPSRMRPCGMWGRWQRRGGGIPRVLDGGCPDPPRLAARRCWGWACCRGGCRVR